MKKFPARQKLHYVQLADVKTGFRNYSSLYTYVYVSLKNGTDRVRAAIEIAPFSRLTFPLADRKIQLGNRKRMDGRPPLPAYKVASTYLDLVCRTYGHPLPVLNVDRDIKT